MAGKRVLLPSRPSEHLHFLSVDCRYERDPPGVEDNMYGEPTEYERTHEEIIAIGHFARGEARSSWWQRPAGEVLARRLGSRMIVRISGKLGEWSRGRSIICGIERQSAVILFGEIDACIVNGRIERIEYVDTSDGRVVASIEADKHAPPPRRR